MIRMVLFLLLAMTRTGMAQDLFDVLDVNHDGFLDKTEYQQGLAKLSSFLQQPLATASASAAAWNPLVLLHMPEVSLRGFWKAFTSSFAMILATEIGDKTFFIAAVLSMKYSRSAVFLGAIAALIIMTILSTAMGLVLPSVMPRKYTHWLSGALFLYFGCKLVYDSRSMESGRASDELEEVEEELLQQSNKKEDEEEGRAGPGLGGNNNTNGGSSKSKSANGKPSNGGDGTTTTRWHTIALQSLTLTFLAEWGDRSQIATIALASSKNPIGVTIGGCLGHAICTGLAVLGGRMLAARISEKTVCQVGGVIFFIFGIHAVVFEE
jgi:Ca2+/H+ antiporter, TMEM165/GDT1 family